MFLLLLNRYTQPFLWDYDWWR